MQEISSIIGHLKNQFRGASPILFLGAGFSLEAKNPSGKPVPSVEKLKQDLWGLVYESKEYEKETPLQDLFQITLKRQKGGLTSILRESFTVDFKTLPPWYKTYFSLPWHRIYTLNIDNLPSAAAVAFSLPRKLDVISTRSSDNLRLKGSNHKAIEVICINGNLGDEVDKLTFGTFQYAERASKDDPWYIQLVEELVDHPVVFVGTNLDEPSL
jgi:hypothetical protein